MKRYPLPIAVLFLFVLVLPSAMVHPGCGPAATPEPDPDPTEPIATAGPDDGGHVGVIEDTNDQNGVPVPVDRALQIATGRTFVSLGTYPYLQFVPVGLANQGPPSEGNQFSNEFVASCRTDPNIIVATAGGVTLLDMLDGSTFRYSAGLPVNSEIAGMSCGCGGVSVFVNAPGTAGTGVYRLDRSAATFQPVRLFGTSDNPALYFTTVHALGTSVLVGHAGTGPSDDQTGCGANLVPRRIATSRSIISLR